MIVKCPIYTTKEINVVVIVVVDEIKPYLYV